MFKIIDFHTHPYLNNENICQYQDSFEMPHSLIKKDMDALGIGCICGSVIDSHADRDVTWKGIKALNDTALELAESYDGFYVPGFHVSPIYLRESLEEVERMHRLGVNLVGELVPYMHAWKYDTKGLDEIIDLVTEYDMIFSFHTSNIDEAHAQMVKKHPKTRFVSAHPGEKDTFLAHLELMKVNENYCLDLSGTGLFRHMMLAYGIKTVGVERFIFGSDYPVCNPAVYVGGVVLDPSLTDSQKEAVLYGNAARLLTETNNRYFKN